MHTCYKRRVKHIQILWIVHRLIQIHEIKHQPLKIVPTTNNQLKKLEDEMVNDDESEAQRSFAFHYTWSHQCLEFAIDTYSVAYILTVVSEIDPKLNV